MNEHEYKSVDKFDRLVGALAGLPDVTQVKPSTVQTTVPLTGEATTTIVRTYRQREVGDWITLEIIDAEGGRRLYLPPAVADAIARQRDALGTKNRKRAARDEAARRKAAGIVPGFMNGKKRRGKKARRAPAAAPAAADPLAGAAPEFKDAVRALAAKHGKDVGEVMAEWAEYVRRSDMSDQSPVLPEFEQRLEERYAKPKAGKGAAR
jgi:hypothetical protein